MPCSIKVLLAVSLHLIAQLANCEHIGRGRNVRIVSRIVRVESSETHQTRAANNGPPSSTSVQSLNATFTAAFTHIRNHKFSAKLKQQSRDYVLKQFVSFGLETYRQHFNATVGNSTLQGVNLIGILVGRNRNLPSGEGIIVVGNHYDTQFESPGVDDNGSGSVATIEIASKLRFYKGALQNTITFVLFDLEEEGELGSLAFARNFLIDGQLIGAKRKNVFLGAYIFDMLLVYDDRVNSQEIPQEIATTNKKYAKWETNVNKGRGDFISVYSRKGLDTKLYVHLCASWHFQGDKYKLVIQDIPGMPRNAITPQQKEKFAYYVRSDQSSFWYHGNPAYNHTLIAVHVSDIMHIKRYYKKCYHKACDDTRLLTTSNLKYMVNTVNGLAKAVYNLAKTGQYGQCDHYLPPK